MKRDYQPPRHDHSAEEVNFELARMQQAIGGERFTMPENMSREDFRVWMRENAEKCRDK
ncbi:hypothetical protein ACM110_14315 [Pseudomonas sp. NFX98]